MNIPVPCIEPLEARIAPAMATLLIVDAHTATYTDTDNDLVTVKVSKGTLTAANFTGDPGGMGDQLKQLTLTDPTFAGAAVTITAVPTAPGDGFVNVGYINATGVDLGAVNVHGDLGAIDAGDATTKSAGLKGLTVQSFGTLGTTTGAPNLNSDIVGALGALNVKGTMDGAVLNVTGGADGKVGSVTIGLSLLQGTVHGTGDIGKVKIGGDLEGGGAGIGSILGDRKIASVSIGGIIFGGAGVDSGVVHSGSDMGKVSVAGDILGVGIVAGPSGGIVSGGKLGDVFVGGSLQASILISDAAPQNAVIKSAGDMGKVTIAQNINGAGTPDSATITSGGKIASVTVGGTIYGGVNQGSAKISAATSIGKVAIAGDFFGGGVTDANNMGNGSGVITAPIIGSLTIAGDFVGGRNFVNGTTLTDAGLISATSIKLLSITGNFIGGETSNPQMPPPGANPSVDGSGKIDIDNIDKLIIRGGLFGGNNNSTAGTATDAGVIVAVNINSAFIGGSLRGGSTGTATIEGSGVIAATGKIKTLTILGDIDGGGASGAGGSVDGAGAVFAGHIDKMLVVGSVFAGSASTATSTAKHTGSINLTNDIGSLTIRGSLIGDPASGGGPDVPVVISARGQATPGATKDLAIGSLTIGGSVTLARILAGYDPSLTPVNGNAQIGKVGIIGNWTTSNLVAGATNFGVNTTDDGGTGDDNVNFGDANDHLIGSGTIASIASITIGGVISGTTGGTDHFGFVTHTIGKFTLGGLLIPLAAGPSLRDIGPTGDVSIHLV